MPNATHGLMIECEAPIKQFILHLDEEARAKAPQEAAKKSKNREERKITRQRSQRTAAWEWTTARPLAVVQPQRGPKTPQDAPKTPQATAKMRKRILMPRQSIAAPYNRFLMPRQSIPTVKN